jgi:uncharacterized membrane protein
LLLGAAGGMAYKKWQDNPWHSAKNDMSPETQEMLKQRFGEMHKEMEPLFAEMKKNRNEMRALLQQQEFDAVRFDLVTQNYRKMRREMSEKMSDVTKQIASQMPAQDRQKMADQFVRGFGWKYAGGGRKGDCDYGRGFGPPPPKEERY